MTKKFKQIYYAEYTETTKINQDYRKRSCRLKLLDLINSDSRIKTIDLVRIVPKCTSRGEGCCAWDQLLRVI